MKNNNIISPTGLKGKQINDRMLTLMNINEGVDVNTKSVVELTKKGPDGNAYAIVRESHEYYIKMADKTEGLVFEDFKYIGGLMNKKSEVYESYAKATKQLNMKFKSLNEAYGISDNINTLLDDNLLETHGMKADKKLGGKAVGDNKEYILDKNGDKLEYDASEDKENSGDNLVGSNGKKKASNDFKKVKVDMSENELAIDRMITGKVEKPIKKEKKGLSISRAHNDMDGIVESVYGSDKVDNILEGLSKSEKEAMFSALKKKA